MRIFVSAVVCSALLGLSSCSSSEPTETKTDEVHVVPAGDKATAGHLTYSIVDSQILTQLGDEASPRIPKDRFILVHVAVSNSSNVDNPIPAIELLADNGKTYDELTDGSGVTDWLGLIRHVGPSQTQRGEVVFDAPAAHYRLRVSDENMNNEILADLPLSYSHEKIDNAALPPTELPDLTAPTGLQKAR